MPAVGELKLIQSAAKSTNILLNHPKVAGLRLTSGIKFKKPVVTDPEGVKNELSSAQFMTGRFLPDSCPIPLIFVGYCSIKQTEWTQISIQTDNIPWAL